MKKQEADAWLADLRAIVSRGDLVEPPGWVLERARRLFRTRAMARVRPSGILTRIRASLVFDSRLGGLLAPVGVRSATAVLAGPWQLLYRGGDVDVDLLVRPNKDGRTLNIRGQALSLVGPSVGSGIFEALPADLPRALQGPPVAAAWTEMKPSGEFALANLERGRYDILLRFGAREIELSGVEL
jgi:hypothetical protein